MVVNRAIMKIKVTVNNVVIAKSGIGIKILLKKQIIMFLSMDIGVIFANELLLSSGGRLCFYIK